MGRLTRESLHDIQGWNSQFCRMERWYKRLTEHDEEDYLFAFFQNCYILRDWLMHDGLMTDSEWSDFKSKYSCIQDCSHICNGTKHGKLRPNSMHNNPKIGRELVEPGVTQFYIVIDNRKLLATELARQCLDAWTEYLSSR